MENQQDALLDTSNTSLINMADTRPIAFWADNKKNEFLKTFKERVEVAAWLLEHTAHVIIDKAIDRKFISNKHTRNIQCVSAVITNSNCGSLHGRNWDELQKIAEERANTVLKKLPILKNAIKVVDAETFKLLEQYDRDQKSLQEKKDTLDELSGTIDMNELDQNMTIGAFRKYVKKIEADRASLLAQLSREGRALQELDVTISKRLYAGIPGISEAIIKVINQHYERITALQAMTRRVEEQVKFGDSAQALELLKHFEKDEAIVSDTVQAEFDEALKKLALYKKPKTKGKK